MLLRKLDIAGVKTNIGFLINVFYHPKFLKGECDTGFIDENPELFDIAPQEDDEARILKFIGEKVVNESNGIKKDYDVPEFQKLDNTRRY